MSNTHVFVGYDSEQDGAYRACVHSIRKHSLSSTFIHPMRHRDLRKAGLFNRAWFVNGDGSWSDVLEGRPFSTQFAFTRFLTPQYYDYLGLNLDPENRWAVFTDSDFIYLHPVEDLTAEAEKTGQMLSVVKHNYHGKGKPKMDGRDQLDYNYKLWSSLMVFDMKKWPSDELMNVNVDKGIDLHSFDWYTPGPEAIGSLNEAWNFIPGHSEKTVLTPKAIHYTEGTPLHQGYENGPMSNIFKKYHQEALMESVKRIGDGL